MVVWLRVIRSGWTTISIFRRWLPKRPWEIFMEMISKIDDEVGSC